MEQKRSRNLTLAVCLAVCLGFAASEIVKSDPLVRLIPADVLRGKDLILVCVDQKYSKVVVLDCSP